MPELTLEETLRSLANAGELTNLSIHPVAGPGPHGVVYSAAYSPASKWGHGMARDADPVKALLAAIHDTRLKSLVNKLKINTAELPAVAQTPPTLTEVDPPPLDEPEVKADEIPDDFLATE